MQSTNKVTILFGILTGSWPELRMENAGLNVESSSFDAGSPVMLGQDIESALFGNSCFCIPKQLGDTAADKAWVENDGLSRTIENDVQTDPDGSRPIENE